MVTEISNMGRDYSGLGAALGLGIAGVEKGLKSYLNGKKLKAALAELEKENLEEQDYFTGSNRISDRLRKFPEEVSRRREDLRTSKEYGIENRKLDIAQGKGSSRGSNREALKFADRELSIARALGHQSPEFIASPEDLDKFNQVSLLTEQYEDQGYSPFTAIALAKQDVDSLDQQNQEYVRSQEQEQQQAKSMVSKKFSAKPLREILNIADSSDEPLEKKQQLIYESARELLSDDEAAEIASNYNGKGSVESVLGKVDDSFKKDKFKKFAQGHVFIRPKAYELTNRLSKKDSYTEKDVQDLVKAGAREYEVRQLLGVVRKATKEELNDLRRKLDFDPEKVEKELKRLGLER